MSILARSSEYYCDTSVLQKSKSKLTTPGVGVVKYVVEPRPRSILWLPVATSISSRYLLLLDDGESDLGLTRFECSLQSFKSNFLRNRVCGILRV